MKKQCIDTFSKVLIFCCDMSGLNGHVCAMGEKIIFETSELSKTDHLRKMKELPKILKIIYEKS